MSRFIFITGLVLLLGSPMLGQQQIPQPSTFRQTPRTNGTFSTRNQRAQAQQPGHQQLPEQSVPIPPSMEEMQRRGALRINPNQSPQMPAGERSQAQGQGSTSPVQANAAQMPQQQAVQPAAGGATGATSRPANPPRISYAGGQLTVIADNSQLSDILHAVGRTTGAHLEGSPPDSERVFGQFGPGSTRDVLNSLLTGSRYDYILLGSLDAPGSVDRIVLSPHSLGAANGTAVAGVPNQQARPNYNPNPPQQAVEEENNTEDNGDNSANVPETEPPPQPEPQPQAQQENNANPPNGQQQPNQIKTPEQLLQELQRLRQQQQQNQQQQPQQNPQ